MKPLEICFISAVTDIERYNKSLSTWQQLTVPNGFTVNSLAIQEAASMTEAYQIGMESSTAKYKVYIHQDVEITQKNFLQVMVDIFRSDANIGMAGVVGSKNIPQSAVWWEGDLVGAIRDDHTGIMENYLYERSGEKCIEAAVVDGLLMMTQYDIPWRTDIFDQWHFYDLSQCMEFRKRGYSTAVLPQIMPGVTHYCGQNAMLGYEEARIKFIREYESNHNIAETEGEVRKYLGNKKKKIVVVSITKVEDDILESFVRHSLTFADEILIANNAGTEETNVILQNLLQEGLPIIVKDFSTVGFEHAEIMNQLVYEAVRDLHADLILPLDVDEFLVNTESPESVRNVLQELDDAGIYHFRWRKYEPISAYTEDQGFLLHRPSRREAEWRKDAKVAFGRRALTPGFKLIQGCHYAYIENKMGRKPLKSREVPYLHLAHYHWRSDERFAMKIGAGCLGTIAKYTRWTPSTDYLLRYYHTLMKRGKISADDVLDDQAENFDLSSYCQWQPVKYINDKACGYCEIIMQEAERIAEAYAELNVLQKKKSVAVLLPYFGGNWEEQLLTAQAIDYPFKRIYLCNYTNNQFGEQTKALTIEPNINILSNNDISTELLARVREDYVQWILPGEHVKPDLLKKMIAVMESQDLPYYLLIAEAEGVESSFYYKLCKREEFHGYYANPLWKDFLRLGKYPEVTLSCVLIRRAKMESCRYLDRIFTAERIAYFHIWQCLLKTPEDNKGKQLVGAAKLPGSLIKAAPENFFFNQIDWFSMLCANKISLGENILQEALLNLANNRDFARKYQSNVSSHLWRYYQRIFE